MCIRDRAIGNAQPVVRSGDDMGEGLRAIDHGYAIVAVLSDGLGGVPGEDGNVDRDLVNEHPEAAADGGAIVTRWSEDETHARRYIDRLGREAIAVEALSLIHIS